jgi:sigma-B regulation protein RsbU (phosphoserine phosphatase)
MEKTDFLNILLVEDNKGDVGLLKHVLKKAGINHELSIADSEAEFCNKLDNFKPDVILSDHSLPVFNSLEALKIVRGRGMDIPFILVTGTVSEEFAIQAMEAGADDYILKDRLARLPSSIEACFSRRKISREKIGIESIHAKLQQAFQDLEEKNRNITDSMLYARRIKDSLLPGSEALKKIFPESFILNKPKELLGGDFYWFTEQDGMFYIAVADCTGHGVPGALMSMIGFGILNEIVVGNQIFDPSEILKHLNTGIRKALKQDILAGDSHLGMDIACCCIDRKKQTILFAGANRPLILCRRDEKLHVKGNKGGIGGFQLQESSTFTTHQIPYQAGDTLYLYSDGYSDQFGGKKKKKIRNRDVQKMLQSFHVFDAAEQELLYRQWIDKWKAELEQTDDILLVGIKF